MQRKNDLVYFIIVSFNASGVIEECLESILKQDYESFKVLIVDNNSTDHSVELMRKKYPSLKLITLEKNYGFARANNIAINSIWQEKPKFIAFINTDVVLEPNWLSSLIEFMDNYQYDFAQSIITDYQSENILDSLGIGISRHLRIYDRNRGEPLPNKNNHETIFGPCFAAAVFKREVVESVRGKQKFLEEEFKTFYEDVDCCFRANYNGFKAGVLSKPLCRHRRSFTADKRPFYKYFYLGRNYFLLLGKHIPAKIIYKNLTRIVLDRLIFLSKTIRNPSFFFGFITGTLFGITKMLGKFLFPGQYLLEETIQKAELLDKIQKGVYE